MGQVGRVGGGSDALGGSVLSGLLLLPFCSHGYAGALFGDFYLEDCLAAALLILANATGFGDITCNVFFSTRNPVFRLLPRAALLDRTLTDPMPAPPSLLHGPHLIQGPTLDTKAGFPR